jgi:hypothetical protein
LEVFAPLRVFAICPNALAPASIGAAVLAVVSPLPFKVLSTFFLTLNKSRLRSVGIILLICLTPILEVAAASGDAAGAAVDVVGAAVDVVGAAVDVVGAAVDVVGAAVGAAVDVDDPDGILPRRPFTNILQV